ncbi:MAG: hypothetical protein NTW21_14910 [Verrucomicrobia bacterium]|nr:hypothetical protein [Verrucomicrobiota bacterium]
MDSSKLKVIIVATIAVFCSLYLGMAAATAQTEAISWVLGGSVLVVCVLMGRRIWLLIPFLGAVDLTLRIPGLPSTMMLAQILVLGFSVLLLAMRRLSFRLSLTELEIWIIILSLMVFQVYVRNPVGVSLFGGTTVGGKPYALYILALAAAVLLAGMTVEPGDLRKALVLSILGSFVNLGVALLGKVFPVVAFYTGATYQNLAEGGYAKYGTVVDQGAAGRDLPVSIYGQKLSLWICAFKQPLIAALQPPWLLLILISLACVAYGGFRSGVMGLLLTYFVGIAYRGGLPHLIASGLILAMGIASIALLNVVYPLPPNVQRSLSFIPGTWQERYVRDAEGSTDWRVEIWKEVIFTDRWISNKYVGDGLGFTAKELAYQLASAVGSVNRLGVTGWDLHRQAVLANGDYHSGPVSSVRVVGYVGLIVILLFQFRLAVHAHRQIMRCRGTEWHPLALLIGIPLIWSPFYFVFIFGDFRSASLALLMGSAMVRLLERSLPLPAWSRAASRLPHTGLHAAKIEAASS